jgi:DNA-binding GntR family transcriptional regulator
MSDQIRDHLLECILEGTYAPGHRFVELDLAAEFQVSQSPVREALRELEVLGAVESQRYKGTRVRSPNPVEMAEAYVLRAILEQRSAELAVPCPTDVLDSLRATLASLHEAAQDRDVTCYSRHALDFHRSIVVQSGNHLFLEIWENVQTRARLPFVAQHLAAELDSCAALHDPILAALENGDGALAGRLLRAFMESLLDKLPR